MIASCTQQQRWRTMNSAKSAAQKTDRMAPGRTSSRTSGCRGGDDVTTYRAVRLPLNTQPRSGSPSANGWRRFSFGVMVWTGMISAGRGLGTVVRLQR